MSGRQSKHDYLNFCSTLVGHNYDACLRRQELIPWKVLEAAFSRLWLLALPIILAPVAVLLLTQSSPEYSSRANVWVSRPANVDPGVFLQNSSTWLTPAQSQAQVLNDLLRIRSFRLAVAESAGLQPTSGEEAQGGWVSTGASAIGTNLVQITATASHPELAPRLVGGVISEYRKRFADEATRAANSQVDYFSVQLQDANEELETRRAQLAQYEAANPVEEGAPVRFDFERERLANAVQSQQLIVTSLLQALQSAQRSAAAAPQALEATFSVQDPPSAPLVFRESRMKQIGYPFIGILFGAGIAATYLYVVFRTDYSIRTSEDLIDLPVPLLGYVPQLPRRNPVGWMRFGALRWWPIGRSRDFAKTVAASMSFAKQGEV